MIDGALACGAISLTNIPINVIKSKTNNLNFFHDFSTIKQNQGLKHLFSGWQPTIIGQSFQG
jgi:hypothetical protein